MKKLLSIIIFSLLWCNISFSKDLSGTKLLCDKWTTGTFFGIEFKNSKEGIFYEIVKEKKWSINKDKITYKVTPDYIFMDGEKYSYKPTLTRKTLKLNNSFQCEILDIEDMDDLIEFALEKLKVKNESENKL